MEGYLYGARGHRALEQSVFAAGEREGFSERTLRRACFALDVIVDGDCWQLPAHRAEALAVREMAGLGLGEAPDRSRAPAGATGMARLRRNVA